MENIASHLDLVHLRKVSALVVTNPDGLAEQEGLGGGCEGGVGGVEGAGEREESHMATSMSDLGKSVSYVCYCIFTSWPYCSNHVSSNGSYIQGFCWYKPHSRK